MKLKGGRKRRKKTHWRVRQPGSEFLTLDYSSMTLSGLRERLGQLYSSPSTNRNRAKTIELIGKATIGALREMEKAGAGRKKLIDTLNFQMKLWKDLSEREQSSVARYQIGTTIRVLDGIRGTLKQGGEAIGPRTSQARSPQKRRGREIEPVLPTVPRPPPLQKRFKRREGKVYFGERRGREIWVSLFTLEKWLEGIPERYQLRALMKFNLYGGKGSERVRGKKEELLGGLARQAIYKAKAVSKKEPGKTPNTLTLLRYIERQGKPL